MTFREVILASNPTHYWPFQESGGTITSDLVDPDGTGVSVNQSLGFQGPATGDGAASVANAIPRGFQALVSKVYLTSPFTIEVWSYWIGANGTYQMLCMYGTNVSDIELRIETTAKVHCRSRGGTDKASTANAIAGGWSQYIFRHSAGVGSFRVNNANDWSQAFTLSSPGDAKFALGLFTDATQPFNGMLGPVIFWNTALSDAECAAHYAAADLKAMPPVFQGGPTLPFIQDMNAKLDLVLESVRKNFP